MECHRPVDVTLCLDLVVKAVQEVLYIDHTVMLPVVGRVVTIPVLIHTDHNTCIGIRTLDRIVCNTESLYILTNVLFIANVSNISPLTNVHFVTDHVILSRAGQCHLMHNVCHGGDTVHIAGIQHILERLLVHIVRPRCVRVCRIGQRVLQRRVCTVIVELNDLCGTQCIGITVLQGIDVVIGKNTLRSLCRVCHTRFGGGCQQFRIQDVLRAACHHFLAALCHAECVFQIQTGSRKCKLRGRICRQCRSSDRCTVCRDRILKRCQRIHG